ncbi:MAG: PilT/PilU family type 4a pilus ATPase [Candidatus Omnitrophica bacterium]|nr:PilT/PilU family type 4a pilus ATPase [Candidatus Omnitrophota bacterium]
MEYKEKRGKLRYPLRVNVHYERIFPDGTFDIPMSVPVRDLGLAGISFFSEEKLEINCPIRVKVLVARDESIVFEGRTVRVMISERKEMHYIVGVSIEEIATADLEKLKNFLVKVDIHNVLDNIDLENVVDIHLVAGYAPIKKKIGKLVVEEGEPFDEYVLKHLLLAMLDGDRYIKFMNNKEFNFVLTTRKGRRFRVNLHIQQGCIEGAFRPISAQIDAPASLGLSISVENLLLNKSGLILVSGRTGSGKTTTLASMIEFVNNKRGGLVVCIEEPIEYVHVNKRCIIKQREVGRDTLSFSNAAKNALRQNPDILVVGEILDMETMETAITAAETGALVLTSIHAGDAAQSLDRVSSFFPGDIQKHILKRLSLILRGVISQDLIPRVDETGLVLSTEIMVVTNAVRRAIREADWKQIPLLIQVGKNVGMQTMQSSLRGLYDRGLIDLEYMTDELI